MTVTPRRFFLKGSRMIDAVNDGEARFVHDAWIQQGRLRPIAQPDLSQSTLPASGNAARGLWAWAGRIFTSPNRRSYSVARMDWVETIVVTEETASNNGQFSARLTASSYTQLLSL